MTAPAVLGGSAFGAVARRIFQELRGRVAIHVRWPGGPGRRLFETTRALVAAAEDTGGRVVVNGRPDVALAVDGVHGVQAGRRSLPVTTIRTLVGDRRRIGASVHGSTEAVAAARDGADWIVLGTIFPTPSHPAGPTAGPQALTRCREALEEADLVLPLVAIGGIGAGRVRAVREAGADGIAVVRAVWDAPDPVAAATRLVGAMEETE